MKPYFLNSFIFILFAALFSSCGSGKSLEEKVNETIAEEVAEAITGQELETSNISDIDKASVELSLEFGDKKLKELPETKPVIQIIAGNGEDEGKVTIGTSVGAGTDKKEDGVGFTLNLSGLKSELKLPTTIDLSKKEGTLRGGVNAMYTIDKRIVAPLSKSGTLTVSSFSDEEVVFEIDAVLEDPASKDMIPLKGKVICKKPMMSYVGVKKEEVFQ